VPSSKKIHRKTFKIFRRKTINPENKGAGSIAAPYQHRPIPEQELKTYKNKHECIRKSKKIKVVDRRIQLNAQILVQTQIRGDQRGPF